MLPQALKEKYQTGGVIAENPGRVVRVGMDRETKQLVAIKHSVLSPELSENPLMEGELLSRLNSGPLHPNVVRLLRFFREGHDVYTIMEMCDREDVLARVMKHGVDLQEAKRLFKQLMSAVHFMHTRGVVHLDLTPENLLLTPTGDLKVTDFGQAKEIPTTGELPAARRAGKMPYMAPEYHAGEACSATAVDLYACGVILFVLLCGATPFPIPASSFKGLDYLKQLRAHWDHALPQVGYAKLLPDPALELVAELTGPPERRPSADLVLKNDWLRL